MRDDPLALIHHLHRHDIPFVVIGGHAVTVHGYPRATEDTDIVFLRTPASEERLLAALQEIHAAWVSNEKDADTGEERRIPVDMPFIKSRSALWLITDLGFLDIFDHLPGLPGTPVEDLLRDALVVDGIRYASRRMLLLMKAAAGRPRDLQDIAEIGGDPERP